MRPRPPGTGNAIAAVAMFTLLLATLCPSAQAAITPESLLDWQYVADPRYSPDGRRLAYVRVETDAESNRYRAAVWVIEPDGEHRRVTAPGMRARAPRWAPDGRTLAFLAQVEGKRQVHLVTMVAGESRQATALPGGVASYAWSPDGGRLAVASRPPAPTAEGDPAAFVTDDLIVRADGRPGWRSPMRRHLWIVELGGELPARARQVTSGEFDDNRPAWSADGRSLYFSSVRKPQPDYRRFDTAIYRVGVDGTREPVLVADQPGPDDDPLPSPDGEWIAFTGMREDTPPPSYRPTELFVMRPDGSERRMLTAGWEYGVADTMAGDVNAPLPGGRRLTWSADGSHLYFTTAVRGQVQLARADLADGSVREVTSFDQGELRSISIGAGERVAAVYSRPDLAPELVSFPLAKARRGGWRRLTSLNQTLLADADLAEYEELLVESFDGTEIQAWLIKPARFDARRRYPLILYVHGGPHAMYGTNFFHEFQVLSAAGYLVLIANPRGSTGYGEAFGNVIQYRYPGDDYADLMAVVDAAAERPYVDERRLGVAGGSGGGLLTTWIVGRTDRFAAASAHRSVTNWLSFVGTSDFNRYFVERWFEDYPWRDPESYLARSPLSRVDEVTTPVQIIHSDADYRTPLEQGLQFYTALKMLGKTAELVVFPDESHGLSRTGRPRHRAERLEHVLRWFDGYLKDGR